MAPPSARWKRREREAARLLGTERLPSNGRRQADFRPIVAGHQLSVEHKSLGRLPLWLADAFDQAARNAGDDELPMVVLSAGAGPGKPLRRVALVDLNLLPALLALMRVTDDGQPLTTVDTTNQGEHP